MHPIRVLIVDDEPNVALTLAAGLEKLGGHIVVDVAHNFNDAFSQVQQRSYALLIADYKMPDLSGLDLARAVRLVSPDTQIVLMTAYGTERLRGTTQLLGIVGYLEKPFTLAQIREIVKRAAAGWKEVRQVLLMEENRDRRLLYSDALRDAGYKVYATTSIPEARSLLASHRFDAFLCAVDIGGERGIKFVHEQSARLRQNGTQVIVISSDGGYWGIYEEMDLEFFLETPVDVASLVTLVDRLTTPPDLT